MQIIRLDKLFYVERSFALAKMILSSKRNLKLVSSYRVEIIIYNPKELRCVLRTKEANKLLRMDADANFQFGSEESTARSYEITVHGKKNRLG